jgi:hypothetical protein
MLKIIQSTIYILLIQIFSNLVFAFFTIVLNLDLYYLFGNYLEAFIYQNLLIIIVYTIITYLFNSYYKKSAQYSYKSFILFILLFICYLTFFYLGSDDLSFFNYFLYIHFPIGALFRTVILSVFTLNVRLSIFISIVTASFGIYIGNKLYLFFKSLKKKNLSPISEQSRTNSKHR